MHAKLVRALGFLVVSGHSEYQSLGQRLRGCDKADRVVPFSSFDSPNPEVLWPIP